MKAKTMCSLSVAAIFAVAIGMTGNIPLAAADWETSNGLQAPAGTISGKIFESTVFHNPDAEVTSATAIDLSLATWNGFEANNFFGTGYSKNYQLQIMNLEHLQFKCQQNLQIMTL